jgi:hypothetical protein
VVFALLLELLVVRAAVIVLDVRSALRTRWWSEPPLVYWQVHGVCVPGEPFELLGLAVVGAVVPVFYWAGGFRAAV